MTRGEYRVRHAIRRLLMAGCMALAGACGGGSADNAAAPGPAALPPGPPAIASAAAGPLQVRISWSGIPPGAVACNLYWDNVPGVTKATGHRIAHVTSPYVHGGRTAGTTYYYVLTSVDGSDIEGPESAPVSATALRVAPDVGQYFDRLSAPANIPDASSHPLRGLTTADVALRFAGTENCLACHYPSGIARSSDECVMCHFEAQPNAPASNHMDGVLQMAAVTGNTLPSSAFPIATLADYDAWCLQCHATTTIGLGGRFPGAAARTLLDVAQVAAGRHRANGVGCIHCHAPHGSANARLVRDNPVNRMAAGSSPRRFGAFPDDNLSGGGYGAGQSVPYRARVDNVAPNVLADADDASTFCDKACHMARLDPSWSKERRIKRNDATGLYLLTGSNKKVYLSGGGEYTVDNTPLRMHGHVNDEIISTDNMVSWYGAATGTPGMTRYKYPGSANADPAGYNPLASPLPLLPDYADGVRDFANGYLNQGPIRYRFTCSTCHDPHGSPYPSANFVGGYAYPDLRLRRQSPNDLCVACHR